MNGTAFDWVNSLLPALDKKKRLQGYYNHNYILEHNGIKYLLRIPIADAAGMDLRLIPENEILQFLEQHHFPAPRVLYESAEPRYSIHSFIEGLLLHDLYPLSENFPDWISIEIGKQMRILHELPISKIKSDLITASNSCAFYEYLVHFTKNIYSAYLEHYGALFTKLGFPEDPFQNLMEKGKNLRDRPFVFSHCDIHRKNIIIRQKNLYILDWELVLAADPMYDIAVHFHKMRYQLHQEDLVLRTYLSEKRKNEFQDLKSQIQIYLDHERVKSAIIDAIRYSEQIKSLHNRKKKIILTKHYLNKLKKAMIVWNQNPTITSQKLLNFLSI